MYLGEFSARWIAGKCVRSFAIFLGFTVSAVLAQVINPIPAPWPNNTSGYPNQPTVSITGLSTTTGVLHAKATPDEWWCNDPNDDYNDSNPSQTGPIWIGLHSQTKYDFIHNQNPTLNTGPQSPCVQNPQWLIPKVDQSYVWGSVQVKGLGPGGDDLIFFGTASNGECVTQGGINPNASPYNSGPWACQFGDSPYSPFPLPAGIGDNRPPRFYMYDIQQQKIQEITPLIGGTPPAGYCGIYSGANPECLDPLWNATRGIRSVTVYTEPATGKTYVFAGGPALTVGDNALNYFAWDVAAGDGCFTSPSACLSWVGKYQYVGYNDQRHWLNLNGVLYAPSGKASVTYTGQANVVGGSLLRYTGNFATLPPLPVPSSSNQYSQIPYCGTQNPLPTSGYACFAFEDVGDVDGVGTDVAYSQSRIFVATWTLPGAAAILGTCNTTTCPGFPYAGIWMSPAIPSGGLTSSNTAQWTKVWSATMYEPDPLVATSYATGAISDYNGYLYWGTMNDPYVSTARVKTYYNNFPATQSFAEKAILDTFRPISLFRSNSLTSATPEIDLLYGYGQWDVYNGATQTFTLTNNNMGGVQPLYGAPGFGNNYNMYTWSMNIWNSRLYVGTMDWGFLAVSTSIPISETGGVAPPPLTTLIPPSGYGADLWYFPSTTARAVPENTNGLGNYLNYGIRNIIPYTYPNGSISLFIGTANAMNLSTTGSGPYGGWELIELKPASIVIKR